MARKNAAKLTIKPANQPAPAPETDGPEDTGGIPSVISAIAALAQDSGGEGAWDIRVYHVTGGAGRGGAQQAFLYPVEPEDLGNLEMRLATEYPGGGRFRVICRRNGELVRNVFLTLAARPGYRPPPPNYYQPVESAPPASAGGERVLLEYLERSDRRQQQFMETMMNRLTQAPPAPVGPSIADIIALAKSIVPASLGGESQLALLKDGITMGRALRAGRLPDEESGGAGGGGFMGLATTFLESPLAKAVAESLNRPAAQPEPATSPAKTNNAILPTPGRVAIIGARVTDQAAGARAPSQQQAKPAWADQVTQAMRYLSSKAEAGADPAVIAAEILPMIPQEVWTILDEQENQVAWLEQRFPRIVGKNRDWFASLFQNLYEPDNDADGLGTQGDHDAPDSDPAAP